MKKLSVCLTLTIILVLLLFLISAMHAGIVQASTNTNGVILADTIWTQANSHYSLTGPLLVKVGATLKIEPGVTVNFNNNYIQVNGTLQAVGTVDQPISFIESHLGSNLQGLDDRIYFTAYSTSWDEATETGSVLQNCLFDQTYVYIESIAPKITNNTFLNCGGIHVWEGSPKILNNYLLNSEVRLVGSHFNPSVIGNHLVGKGIFVFAECPSTILNNLVQDASYGIQLYSLSPLVTNYGSAVVQNNTFYHNTYGVTFQGAGCNDLQLNTLKFNNIFSNDYNMLLAMDKESTPLSVNIDATQNWWGTNDTQAINQTIFDSKNNFNMGTVTFLPFLTSQNPCAPSIDYKPQTPLPASQNSPSAPTVTPTSTTTPNQTNSTSSITAPTPTETSPLPSPTDSTAPSPIAVLPVNPSTTDGELTSNPLFWPLVIISVLLFVVVAVVIVTRRR